MPSITTSLTINNGAASPVAKTFSISEKNPSQTVFEERSSGVQSNFTTLRVRSQKPQGARKQSRTEYKVVQPLLRTSPTGVVAPAAYNTSLCSFTIAEDATADERKDLFAYMVNGLSHALLKPVTTDLDPIY